MKAPGLPDIAGKFATTGITENNVGDMQGCFYKTNEGSSWAGRAGGGTAYYIGFQANRSNSIYGLSNTVQPPALQLIPQIKF